jgi:hypothetical protein
VHGEDYNILSDCWILHYKYNTPFHMYIYPFISWKLTILMLIVRWILWLWMHDFYQLVQWVKIALGYIVNCQKCWSWSLYWKCENRFLIFCDKASRDLIPVSTLVTLEDYLFSEMWGLHAFSYFLSCPSPLQTMNKKKWFYHYYRNVINEFLQQ